MTSGRPQLGRAVLDIVVYTAARLLLVLALTAAIYGVAWLLGVQELPLVVAVLLALIIALPLGMWVFAPLRRRATASLAVADERRRADREQLQARLRGETPSDRG